MPVQDDPGKVGSECQKSPHQKEDKSSYLITHQDVGTSWSAEDHSHFETKTPISRELS